MKPKEKSIQRETDMDLNFSPFDNFDVTAQDGR